MRFIPELPKSFREKDSPNSAKSMYLKSMKAGNKPGPASPEDRYQDILKQKMDEVRSAAMKGAKYTFQLPGTDATEARQLSKGAQEIIEKIAEKNAKRAEKRMKKADVVKVQAKSFSGHQGGRIDGRGHIYDSAGQWVMTVDKKTGVIKNRITGAKLGKYNASCGYSEHRMCELIGQLDTTKKSGWYAGGAAHGTAHPGEGTVWGKEGNSHGNSSIWGSGEGNIWGTGKDDHKSGWW